MEFSITTKGPDEFSILEGLLPDFVSYIFNGAKAHSAFGAFGQMTFQNIAGEGFTIWYSQYFIASDTSFIGKANEPVLELHFIFNNPVEYFLEGVGKSILSDGQFNLTYTPFINNKATLMGGKHYYTFDVHFNFSFLEKFAGGSAVLSMFLDEISTGAPANITPASHFATADMIAVIKSILKNRYHTNYQKFFLESQVVILLLQVLEKVAIDERDTGQIKLSATDIERIMAAKDYLLQNMDNPVSVIQLSRIACINDFKLKKGFKQVFGTTIFQYLDNARLEKALILVQETDKSIAEIGFELGFRYPNHFSAVFKKKFGYPPGHFKK